MGKAEILLPVRGKGGSESIGSWQHRIPIPLNNLLNLQNKR